MAISFKLSVRTKILSGFVLVFILFLAVLIYNLLQMKQLQWQLTIVQQGYLPLTRATTRIANNRQTMEETLKPDRLLSREKLPTNLYLPLALYTLNRFGESLASGRKLAEKTLSLPGVNVERRALRIILEHFEEIEDEYTQYSKRFQEAIRQAGEGKMDEARNSVPILRENMGNMTKSVRELNTLLERRVEAAVESTRERQEQAAFIVAGMSVATILFGLVMIFVTHLVLRPISRLIEGVKFIAGGDYKQRVAIEAEDEIGTLAREFNVMAGSLEEREAKLRRSQADLELALENQKRAHLELKTLSLYNESIIQSIEVGLIVCDREGRLTTLNPAATVIWGLSPETALGRMVDELPTLSNLVDAPRQVLENGQIVRLDTVELKDETDVTRLIDSTIVPLVGVRGTVEGVIILGEDVTERTRTKQRLIQSERLALIGRMSAQVTHEVRNPLNALGLNTELLQDEIEGLDPEAKTDAPSLLKSISREIDRLTGVTETYLRLARLPTPQLERENLGTIVESLLRFLQEEFSSKDIELGYEIGEALPEVMVDENQIRQALLNVLRNSGEAMGDGGHIDVRVVPDTEGILVTIEDNGEGIEPEVLDHIFDPFYSTKITGTGLGLPISQQIIEEHGGRISVSSRPGKGTTFRIHLPTT